MTRFLAFALVLAAMQLAAPNATAAESCASASGTGATTFHVIAECHSSGDAPQESPGTQEIAASVTYSYSQVCERGEGIVGPDFYGCGNQTRCGERNRGRMFWVWAHYPDGRSENTGVQCLEPGEAPISQQVTQADVLRAFRRIPVPASEVSIQPPGGETLVNLDTIFSTEAAGFTRTIGLLGHRVELDIDPASYRWVNGDGTTQVTDWAGKPWAQGTPLHEFITHRYADAADRVRPRVDTTWTARYRVDGGPWRDVGGTVTITGEPFDLAVLSATPHLSSTSG